MTFKQWSLPQKTSEEVNRSSSPRSRVQALREGSRPMGSRTIVQRITQVGLTAGFGMRPGVSPPLWPSNHHYPKFMTIHNLFNDWASKWTISSYGLNTSPKLRAYTLALSNESYIRVLWCLVLRWASCLDAFSIYPLQRGCPAMPCQTTGKLVAAGPCSSRTKGPFPSNINASRR